MSESAIIYGITVAFLVVIAVDFYFEQRERRRQIETLTDSIFQLIRAVIERPKP